MISRLFQFIRYSGVLMLEPWPPIKGRFLHHIETSQLISKGNQLTEVFRGYENRTSTWKGLINQILLNPYDSNNCPNCSRYHIFFSSWEKVLLLKLQGWPCKVFEFLKIQKSSGQANSLAKRFVWWTGDMKRLHGAL